VLKDFRKSRKRRKKEKMDRMAHEMESTLTQDSQRSHASLDPQHGAEESDAIDGVAIDIYAAAMGLSTAEVWSMLRRGELLGRTDKGKLLVFARPGALTQPGLSGTSYQVQLPTEPDRVGASSGKNYDSLELPPLPLGVESSQQDFNPIPFDRADRPQSVQVEETPSSPSAMSYLAVAENKPIHPEIALLLDHLSLAKEENREIIKLTQDALTRVSTMTDTMIKMKDQLIGAKDEQLSSMREVLALRESEIRKLKQEREDLEMLTRTLAEQK